MVPLSELKKRVVPESMIETKNTMKKSFKSKPTATVTRTLSGERSLVQNNIKKQLNKLTMPTPLARQIKQKHDTKLPKQKLFIQTKDDDTEADVSIAQEYSIMIDTEYIEDGPSIPNKLNKNNSGSKI